MKLNLGIMICFALAAMIMAQKDFAKCSLKYLRQVAKESCERIHDKNRVKRDILPGDKDVYKLTADDQFGSQQQIVPKESIPAGATIELRRSRTKRGDGTYNPNDMSSPDWVFYYCCDHIEDCESLPCAINE